jgi:DNA-binding PadR family transcriptional regulator
MEQDGGPEKRIYAITEQGRAALAEWFTQGVTSGHQRDEFYVKLMLTLMTNQTNPYRVIQSQRNQLYQDLHDLTIRRNRANPEVELAQIFLLDKSIMHLEADLRWLDLIEARLDDIRRQPVAEPLPKPRGRPRKGVIVKQD